MQDLYHQQYPQSGNMYVYFDNDKDFLKPTLESALPSLHGAKGVRVVVVNLQLTSHSKPTTCKKSPLNPKPYP